MIGNVIAGSTFAGAQAAGATGIIPAMGLAIAGGVGGAAALVASTLAGVLGYSRFGNACFDRESDQIKNQKARKIRKIEEFRSAPLADLRLSKTA